MSSNLSYNRQLSTLYAASLWLAWACLVATATATPNQTPDTQCCSEGILWNHSLNCSDGTRLRLNCPYGTYLVDPEVNESDNYTVHFAGDNVWLLQENYENISVDRFCLATSARSGKEIALVCFDEQATELSLWRNALFSILSIVSAVFLIVTLGVYIILPELRDIQDKALMAAVTSLAVSYIVLSIQHLRVPQEGDDITCVALAFMLYYAFMSAFFWLNIVAFNIWRWVWFKQFPIRDKALFVVYCVIGWGCPTCFLTATLLAHYIPGDHMTPGFGEHTCWFGGVMQLWAYFYGPIAVLLTLNVIYLGLTSWRLWHRYRDYSGTRLRVLRFKCLLYVKLVLVMGITWIFEVISFAVGKVQMEYVNYWMPTDILNALQGLVIFLLLVATRKRVRKLLAKKKPCGMGFPKSWTAYEDEECEIIFPEELELSQTRIENS